MRLITKRKAPKANVLPLKSIIFFFIIIIIELIRLINN